MSFQGLQVHVGMFMVIQTSFMYQDGKDCHPDNFREFFTPISSKHLYNTSLASKVTSDVPFARINYWKSSFTVFSFWQKLKRYMIGQFILTISYLNLSL